MPRKVRIDLEIDGEVWRRVASLRSSGPEDPHYEVRVNADGTATVTFGDGEHGRRLPTGSDKIIATYRPSKHYTAVVMQQGRVILDSDSKDGGGVPARLCGIYAGIVTDNADPQSRMRVKVRAPAVFGAQEVWALPCAPVGASTAPAVGQAVWIAFEGGDPAHPVWLGTMPPLV